MQREKRKSRMLWYPAIFLLLTLSCLISWTCKSTTVISPVLIGDARITGKVVGGALVWEPNENQGQSAYVVTPAFVKICLGLALENVELKAEIKKLRAKLEGSSF